MVRVSRIAALATALMLGAALLAGCGTGTPPDTGGAQPQGNTLRLTLGTKNFTESVLMGELYAQALTANGYQVLLRKNLGPTEVVDKELVAGEIDAYPEYLGAAATVVVGEDVQGKSAEETAQIARDFYEKRGQAVSAQTPFEDVDAIATTYLFAQQHGLREIGDLRKLDSFTLGARPEFEARQQGFAGMQRVYGLTNGVFKPVDIRANYVALDHGDVDVVNVFSTDAQLDDGRYTVLADPERVFGYQHAALVINKAKLDSLGGDRFMRIINAVNAQLSTRNMMQLNRAVDLDGRDAADVANQFLRENGLLNTAGK